MYHAVIVRVKRFKAVPVRVTKVHRKRRENISTHSYVVLTFHAPPVKEPHHPLNRRSNGAPKQCGQFGKDKNLLFLPEIESRIVELVDESLY